MSIHLKTMDTDTTIRVIGVYAPCRGQGEDKARRQREKGQRREKGGEKAAREEREEQQAQDMWDTLEDHIEGDEEVILMGDMNAELPEALKRSNRAAKTQDGRFEALVERKGLTHMSVGRATYRDTSEIDHIMVTATTRQHVSDQEWRAGQSTGDHGAVWIKMATTHEEDEADKGPRRPTGEYLRNIQKEEWARLEELAMEYTADAIIETAHEGAAARVRARQDAVTKAARQVISEATEKQKAEREKNKGKREEGRRKDEREAGGKHANNKERADETRTHSKAALEATARAVVRETETHAEEGQEGMEWHEEWPEEVGIEEWDIDDEELQMAWAGMDGEAGGDGRSEDEGSEEVSVTECESDDEVLLIEAWVPEEQEKAQQRTDGVENETASGPTWSDTPEGDDDEAMDGEIDALIGAHEAREMSDENEEAQKEPREEPRPGKTREQGKRRAEYVSPSKKEKQEEGGKHERLHRQMSKWIRIKQGAEKWTGRADRASWKVFGNDAPWIMAQGWAKYASEGRTREQRKTRLKTAVEERAGTVIAKWKAYASCQDGDKVIEALLEAVKKKGSGTSTKGGVYVELYKILRAGVKGQAEAVGDQRLRTVYKGGTKEEVYGAKAVREECRKQGEQINQARPVAMKAVKDILEWIDKAGGNRERGDGVQHKKKEDWVDAVCTWERYEEGLERTKAIKGVGVDGFNAYLIKKSPEAIRRGYWEDMKQVIRDRDFPEEWRERIAMLAMKPGEDPADLSRRRDLWLECHGSKLAMWLIGEEYEEAMAWTVPASQAGGVSKRGCPEQSLVMRIQKEQCARERTMCCRAYLDFGVFYMSCVREVQWEVEKWCKVRVGVTETVQAMHAHMTGKYETAHGLTESFDIQNGNPQGCSQSTARSKLQLRMVQETVRIMCEGFKFRGAEHSVPQMWFVDDGAFVAKDLATLQLILDTCWMVTRAAGLEIKIKGIKKTAWQASYWQGDQEQSVTGWQMRLPDGRVVPQVLHRGKAGMTGGKQQATEYGEQGEYTYLGSDETERWGGAQDSVRKKVTTFCTKLLRMIGRVGVLGDEQTRIGMTLGVEGATGFYARATAIGMDACEEVENVRAEVIRQRDMAAGTPRAQIHARKRAGGLGHDHLYQSATAALVDQIDKILQDGKGTPAEIALRAHIETTMHTLAWTERQDMMEWYPTHLADILKEDMIIEAWLLGRLRSGVRMTATGERARQERDEKTGPPIWEPDERAAWRASDGKACAFTQRSRRLAALGIREWRDITHPEGRWNTPEEAQRKFSMNKGSVEHGIYEELTTELNHERWAEARRKWFHTVEEGRAHLPPQEERQEELDVSRIIAARRTAPCIGTGWEVLVEWQAEGTEPTWEAEESMIDKGASQSIRTWVADAKRNKYMARNMLERMAGREEYEKIERGATEWQWQGDMGQGKNKMSPNECEIATRGDLSEPRTKRAVQKMWHGFKEHASKMHGKGRTKPVDKNAPDHAERRRTEQRMEERSAECTMYLGEWEEVSVRDERTGTVTTKKRHRAGLANTEDKEGHGWRMTREHARAREAIAERIMRMPRTQHTKKQLEQAVPKGRPDRQLRWDPEDDSVNGKEGEGIWKGIRGTGHAQVAEEWMTQDPLTRMFVRWDGFETGADHAIVTTPDGQEVKVTVDKAEQKVLAKDRGQDSIQEANKVAQAAVPLHMQMHFHEVWATDGSKGTETVEGYRVTKVACGAYKGMQERTRGEWEQGNAEDWHRTRLSAGMRGMRLPAHYEVVDAEMAAILMVLKEEAAYEDADTRRILIMSDCASALRMIEKAWRARRRREYAMGNRGAMLEAICTYRERIGQMVTMYVPAHRGFSANAYADAAAKACTNAKIGNMSETIREAVQWRTHLNEVWEEYEEGQGRWEIWDVPQYDAIKEAVGWWIVEKEVEKMGDRAKDVLETTRIGPVWKAYKVTREQGIWEKTGASTKAEGRQEEEQEQEDANGDTYAKRTGMAMAARNGDIWRATHGRENAARRKGEATAGGGAATRSWEMGCPACCSRERGWRWSTDRKWWGPKGESVSQHATTMHIMSGKCIAVAQAKGIRGSMKEAIRELQKAITPESKGKYKGPRTEAMGLAWQAHQAIDAEEPTATQVEALRRVIAGDIPCGATKAKDIKSERAKEQRAVRAIRSMQEAGAQMIEAWQKEAEKEQAQRWEEESMRRWVGPIIGPPVSSFPVSLASLLSFSFFRTPCFRSPHPSIPLSLIRHLMCVINAPASVNPRGSCSPDFLLPVSFVPLRPLPALLAPALGVSAARSSVSPGSVGTPACLRPCASLCHRGFCSIIHAPSIGPVSFRIASSLALRATSSSATSCHPRSRSAAPRCTFFTPSAMRRVRFRADALSSSSLAVRGMSPAITLLSASASIP